MEKNFEQEAYGAVEAGTANEGAARAVEMDKLAKAAGFSTYTGSNDGNTFFSWGTELMSSGKDAFRSKAKLHDEKPFVSEIVDGFKGIIAAEKRQDVNRTMKDLLLDRDGRLVSRERYAIDPTVRGLPMSRWALGQILNRAKAPAGALSVLRPEGSDVQGLPSGVASSVFSSYADGAKTAKGRDKSIKLRTRLDNKGNRQVFAALSPRSPSFDADKAVASFAADAHDTARGAVQYDGKRWKFSAGVMSHIEPTVGEIFEGSVWISGTDDGSSAIRIGAEVVRVRCVNLTTLHSVDIESIRHQGAQLSFEEKIKFALAKAHAKISAFADVWAEAERADIADDAQENGAELIFKALVAKRLVWVPGVEADDLSDRLFAAWTAEPGYTKADILNAVTRAAHSNPWSNPWAAQSLSDQAGELLYQNVYVTQRDFSQLDVE